MTAHRDVETGHGQKWYEELEQSVDGDAELRVIMTGDRDAETVHWKEWFKELEYRGDGDTEVWVIAHAESLASGPPNPDYSVLPPFLDDWLQTVDQEEDPADPDAGWRRCAAFLRDDAGLTVVRPEQLLDESRSLFNPHWVSQPPTRAWVAYAFTEDLAIVWRWKDWEKYPVGFASRRALEAGFARLVDVSDDVAGVDYEECITCDQCDVPWCIDDYESVPEAVFADAREADETTARQLCAYCRKKLAQWCDRGCERYLLPVNPADGSSNFREVDGVEHCRRCADEKEVEDDDESDAGE
jgi:hypothetical protein